MVVEGWANDWIQKIMITAQLSSCCRRTRMVQVGLCRGWSELQPPLSVANISKLSLKRLKRPMRPKVSKDCVDYKLPTREGKFVKKRHSRIQNPPRIRLLFLGTGSMVPSQSRNVSSLIVRLGSMSWMFDCGEGTQMQLCRSMISPPSISRIFISHMHGDHFFGLPGCMCSMSSDRVKEDHIVEVYGPPGLRKLLRDILHASVVNFNFRYVVHELHEGYSEEEEIRSNNNRFSFEMYGRNISADADGLWYNLPSMNTDVDYVSVHAAPLRHTDGLPTFGFILKEKDYPGKLKIESVKPHLQKSENIEFFKRKGVNKPHDILKELKKGKDIELANGVIRARDCTGDTKIGRKIVILSDTCDSRRAASLAAGATTVVHEATNAYLPEFDPSDRTKSEHLVLSRTISRGHSTPQMAGAFAQAVEAESLILTHFSARYNGITPDQEDHERAVALEKAFADLTAKEYAGQVVIAHDFLTVEVRGHWGKDWKSPLPIENKLPKPKSLSLTSSRSNNTPTLDLAPPPVVVPKSIFSEDKPFDGKITPHIAAVKAAKAATKFLHEYKHGPSVSS